MKLDFSQFENHLSKVLSNLEEKYIREPSKLIKAAVILPLLEGAKGAEILLTRRTNQVKSHRGQVSFPGGTVSPQDRGVTDTALRETEEEIGVERSRIKVLGSLPPLSTVSTGYFVYPTIAVLLPPFNFKRNEREVREIFTVPLDFVLDEQNWRLGPVETEDGTFTSFYFRYQGYLVWGMTARLLRKFREILIESDFVS